MGIKQTIKFSMASHCVFNSSGPDFVENVYTDMINNSALASGFEFQKNIL